MTTSNNGKNIEANDKQGLLFVIECLNNLIDVAGNRKKMIRDCKDLFIHSYENLQQYFSTDFINQQLKVSNQRIIRLKVAGNCGRSTLKNCLRLYPNQLSPAEQIEIKALLEDSKYTALPRSYIWADAQRKGLHISLCTFYRYAIKILGKLTIDKPQIYKGKKIVAQIPFEILHMDSTQIRCENAERVYIHFIIDNFSRKVLGAVASYASKSPVVAENLKSIIHEYDLYNKQFEIYCDDGPENHGEVVELLRAENIQATKITANYKTGKSNNVIEAWNKKFKRFVLKKFKPKDFEHLVHVLPAMLDYFNNLNQPVLGTLTPNEVINGITRNDLELKQKLANAKEARLRFNQEILCYIDNAIKDCSKPPE